MPFVPRLLIALVALSLPFQTAVALEMLDRIKATMSLTIAFAPNSYPISFRGEDGEPNGYTVDLCRRIAAGIQRDLGLERLDLRWLEGNTPRRLAAVANGEADLDCGTTTINLQRQRVVDFSNIVFVESGGILVASDSGLKELSDLAGKKLGVIPQTTTERRLRVTLGERLINAELVPVKDAKDGREQLDAGAIHALAGDRMVLIGQVAAAGEPERFSILDAEFSIDPYALAMPRNQADFRLAVNRGLAQIYRTGEIDRIFSRWFGADAAPTELLGAVFFLFGFSD
jgi:ABC-type amino acid transport substrate-binding protein